MCVRVLFLVFIFLCFSIFFRWDDDEHTGPASNGGNSSLSTRTGTTSVSLSQVSSKVLGQVDGGRVLYPYGAVRRQGICTDRVPETTLPFESIFQTEWSRTPFVSSVLPVLGTAGWTEAGGGEEEWRLRDLLPPGLRQVPFLFGRACAMTLCVSGE